MALRFLLRLLPPSGPRMAAAARFMKTSCQVEAKTVAEQELRVINKHFRDAQNKFDKDFAQVLEVARQSFAQYSRAADNLRKLRNASVFVVAAVPWIMISGKNYRA